MKMIKKLCVVSIIIGYLCILGSAGAEELNHINATQCDLQTILGVVIAGGGVGVWHILA
jgi:hypothetical protein